MSIGGLFILIIAVSTAASFVVDAVRQTRIREALRGDSSSVVTGWKERLVSGGRGRDERVLYSFSVNGEKYSGESRVPSRQVTAVIFSGLLAIRYLPANPNINHPADWEWSPEWIQIIPLPLGFGMSALLLTAVLMERRLVANGIPVDAEVTSCTPNGKGGFGVRYRFRTQDGTEVQDRGWSASDRDVGDKICVLYLPQNPTRNQAYPGQLIRAAE